MDAALRKFGYVSGQAFQWFSGDQQIKPERVALDVATNYFALVRNRNPPFYYAGRYSGPGLSKKGPQARGFPPPL